MQYLSFIKCYHKYIHCSILWIGWKDRPGPPNPYTVISSILRFLALRISVPPMKWEPMCLSAMSCCLLWLQIKVRFPVKCHSCIAQSSRFWKNDGHLQWCIPLNLSYSMKITQYSFICMHELELPLTGCIVYYSLPKKATLILIEHDICWKSRLCCDWCCTALAFPERAPEQTVELMAEAALPQIVPAPLPNTEEGIRTIE